MTYTYATRLPFKLPDGFSQDDSYRIDTYITVNVDAKGVPEDLSRAIQYHMDTCVAACEKAAEQPTGSTLTHPDSEGRKYELSDVRAYLEDSTLCRIKALRDIPVHGVKKGDLGGFVESEANLSQEGDCWISGDPESWFAESDCTVCQDAHVSGDVNLVGNMLAWSNAKISGKGVIDGRNATFSKDACIKRQSDFAVEGTNRFPITIYRTTDSTAAISGVICKTASGPLRFNGKHPSHLRKLADIPESTAEALVQKAVSLERSWLDDAWMAITMDAWMAITRAGTQGTEDTMCTMKYKLVEEERRGVLHEGLKRLKNCYRVRALRDIPLHGVKKGDIGGFIEKESNLSQEGDCWVGGDAVVLGGARVEDNALVTGGSFVSGFAQISDDAKVDGYAVVSDHAKVTESASISDYAIALGHSTMRGRAKLYDRAMITGFVEVCDNTALFDNAFIANAEELGRAFIVGTAIVDRDQTIGNIEDF